MAVYRYKAVSQDGGVVKGYIEAYDQYEAVCRIKETCSVVTSVTEVASLPRYGKDLFGPRMVSDKELALLCSQFSIILQTGLPLVRAVELICEQNTNRQLKKLLTEVSANVAEGFGLAQSLENKGGDILPTTFIETVRAGEESGTMVESFTRLYTYYDKSAKIKSKVRSAMIYPTFLAILASVVIAIIMVVTMPTFTEMFEEMGTEMPGLTKAIIAVANFVKQFWWLLFLIIAIVVLAFKAWSKTERGQMILAKAALSAPAVGRMNRMKGASQFANTLSTLLTAGIPLVRATQITAKVLDNRHLGRELSMLVPMLEEGRRLGDEMKRQKVFPAMLCEMTVMGEDTGSMEETLETIGSYYDSETEIASQRALSMLQPAITVVMGILIGLIVVGLYLPMFTMYNGM